MCSVKGRIKIAVLTSFGLIVILGLCFAQTGFTWGQTSAARSAVLAFLRQVPPPQPAPDPQVTGREATHEEAAALDKTVNAYLEAIRARQYSAAWELLANTGSELNQETFVDDLMTLEDDEGGAAEIVLLLLMTGHKSRLVDLAVSAREGLAHVAIDAAAPLWLALVKHDGTWRIDSQRSEELAARETVARQLEEMNRAAADSIMQQVLRQTTGFGPCWGYPGLLVLSPQSAKHQAILRKVDADHAVVKLETQGEVHALVPLARRTLDWTLNIDEGIRLVAPDFKLNEQTARLRSEQALQGRCLSNLKQLAISMLSYCQDYDERMPPADKWSSGIWPYVKNEQIFNCPAVEKYGYAMNYKLSRQPMARLDDPIQTIALFDSALLRPNAYDVGTMPGASVPKPPRHGGGNNFAFADGHVKAITWIPNLGWYTLAKSGFKGPQPPPPPPPADPGGPPGDGPGGKKE